MSYRKRNFSRPFSKGVRAVLAGGLSLLLTLFLAAAIRAEEVRPEPAVMGEAAVLVDARTGQVLFEKEMHKRMYPASTTKILTALIALENGIAEETVTVPGEASAVEGSAIGLQAGERLTGSDLLYALMLASANDAAVALAVHAAGSVEKFAVLMNEKARSLGALESNFSNPHGLPDPDHYTSAYDLALITVSAMRNPAFREIVKTKTKVIARPYADRTKGPPQEHLWNHNRFLERYPGATGVKTGYTEDAGQCLVAAAERDGWELIAVVFKSEGNAVYGDVQKMLDYGFARFMPVRLVKKGDRLASVEVAGGEPEQVELVAKTDFWYAFPRPDGPFDLSRRVQLARRVEAPLEAGQRVGRLLFYDREKLAGEVELVAARDVARVRQNSWMFWVAGVFLFFFCLRLRRATRRRRRFSRRSQRIF